MSQLEREKITRAIVAPMIARGWTQPKGNPEAILGDYAAFLGKLPEAVLERTFDLVNREWTYRSWPAPSHFLKAAKTLSSELDEKPRKSEGNDALNQATKISEEAYAYVSRRMSAGDGALLIRSIKAAVDRDIRTFLFVKACDCIRGNREVHVSNAEVEEKFAELAEESAGRLRSREGVKNFQMRRAVEKVLPSVHRFNPETAARVEEARKALTQPE